MAPRAKNVMEHRVSKAEQELPYEGETGASLRALMRNFATFKNVDLSESDKLVSESK